MQPARGRTTACRNDRSSGVKKILIVLVLLSSGCSNFYLDTSDLLRERNTAGLAKLTAGLGKQTVMEIMGTEPSRGVFMWIDNPYRRVKLKVMVCYWFFVILYL
jgi:hypothetical protein